MEPPAGISRADFVRCVDHAIRERRTRKVGAGTGGTDGDAFERAVRESIAVAGFAPFHYGPEPWRFAVLFRPALARLRREVPLDVGKLPVILDGAGALVLATWTPEGGEWRDWQHAAAASAAVQCLLLALEARGLATYWCSTRHLASPGVYRACGVPPNERFLGAVIAGAPLPADREAAEGFSPGRNRARRQPPSAWCRFVPA